MIKQSNTRLTITISKKQYKWLENMSQKLNLKMSKLIAWLLWNKSKEVEHTSDLLEKPKEEIERQEAETMTDEEWNQLLKEFEERKIKAKQHHSVN